MQPVDKSYMPLWRSMLFVPANVPRYVEKAHLRGADAIVVDLEDSIAPDDKDAARQLVPDVVKQCAQSGADIIVRINRPIELAVRDIEAAVSPSVCALRLPKIESASHVRLLAELVEKVEQKRGMRVGHTLFLPVIESVEAFRHVDDIASAHPRNAGLSLGAEDFSASAGMRPDPDVMLYPKQRIVIAARAAGVRPYGLIGSGANFGDPPAFHRLARDSRRFGFQGSTCIHPSLVPLLNEAFSPTAEEIDHAHRVVDEYHKAVAERRGSFSIDGKMVDIPIVERARELLAVAARFNPEAARATST